jgi:hypothetical protein
MDSKAETFSNKQYTLMRENTNTSVHMHVPTVVIYVVQMTSAS